MIIQGGASSIVFRRKVNQGSDYGYIQYQDTSTVRGTGESAKLIIGTQNDAGDDIILLPSGGGAMDILHHLIVNYMWMVFHISMVI